MTKIGISLKCINDKPLTGNDIGPPLVEGRVYPLNEVIVDKKGNEHFDVGLLSKFNYVTSYETGEELERGYKIHWCHPSRFEIV